MSGLHGAGLIYWNVGQCGLMSGLHWSRAHLLERWSMWIDVRSALEQGSSIGTLVNVD